LDFAIFKAHSAANSTTFYLSSLLLFFFILGFYRVFLLFIAPAAVLIFTFK